MTGHSTIGSRLARGMAVVMACGGLAGLAVAGSTTAASATSAGPTAYEVDCASGSPITGTTGWVVGMVLDTSANTVAPGAKFGASGVAALVAPGYFIAGAVAGTAATVGNGVPISMTGVTIGSTDGSATGSYSTTLSGTTAAVVESAHPNATYSSGSTTITDLTTPFTISDVGSGVTGTGIPTGAYVASVTGGVATLAAAAGASPTTIAGSTGDVKLYPSQYAIAPIAAPNTTFTPAPQTVGTVAKIGLTSVSKVTAGNFGTNWGGTPGYGASKCLLTGYGTLTGNPGPAQYNPVTFSSNPAPVLGAPSLGGGTNPLVAASGGFLAQAGASAAITPAAAASATVGAPTTPPAPTGVFGPGAVSLTGPDVTHPGFKPYAYKGAPNGKGLRSLRGKGSITLKFKGTALALYLAKGSSYGKAAVQIDGKKKAVIDLYSKTSKRRFVYKLGNLTDGTHTLKLVALHKRNSRSTGFTVVAGWVKVS